MAENLIKLTRDDNVAFYVDPFEIAVIEPDYALTMLTLCSGVERKCTETVERVREMVERARAVVKVVELADGGVLQP